MNKIFLTLLFGLMAFMLSAQYTFTVADCELTVLKDAVQHKVLNLHELEVRESSSTAFVLRDKINRVRFSANIFQCDDYATNALFLAFVDSVKLECNFPSSGGGVVSDVIWNLGTQSWDVPQDSIHLNPAEGYNDGNTNDNPTNAIVYAGASLVGDSIALGSNWIHGVVLNENYDSLEVRGTVSFITGATGTMKFHLFKFPTESFVFDVFTFGGEYAYSVGSQSWVAPSALSIGDLNFNVTDIKAGDRIMIFVERIGGDATSSEMDFNLSVIGYKTL